jgi:Zn-finger nucleic acid-binding protein
MICHICNEKLNIVKKDEISLNICPICKGIAIKDEDLKEIILMTKKVIKKEQVPPLKKIDIMKYAKQKTPLSKCPNCRYNMYVVENNGLELDYCLNCKTFWFDEGELASFIKRYESGKVIILESSEYTDDSIINLIFSFI